MSSDGWTSKNNQHYITLTVHFLNSETKLCFRLIGFNNYNDWCTSDELALFLMATAKKWDIDNKISAVVADNALNMAGAVQKNN